MNRVLLVVIFKGHAQPLQICLPRGEAESLVRAFVSGAKSGYAQGYIKEEDFTYALDWTEIAAMHVSNLELLQKRQEEMKRQEREGKPSVPPGYPGYDGRSGRN